MKAWALRVLMAGMGFASVAGAAILKGPYLQNVTQDGVTVMWESDRAGAGRVDYGVSPTFGKTAEDTTLRAVHQVRLSGLEMETGYHYRVRSHGDVSGEFTFRTAPRRDSPFAFGVYGDDRTNPPVHAAVIQTMAKYRLDLILHTGDLVASGRNYDLWGREFFGPAGDLIARVPLYPVLGNHEGNAEPYYRFFSLPSNGSKRFEKAWYSFDYGNAHFIALDSNASTGGYGPGSEQYAWLEEDLRSEAARSATWRIAFFHHPLYSSGSHESSLPQREALVPAFEKHGVDLAFAGHDHIYERSWPLTGDRRDDRKGIVYVVTGGGGAPLYDVKWSPWTAAARKVNHFCLVSVEGGRMTLDAVDVDASRFDGTVLDRDRSKAAGLVDTARTSTGLKRLFALRELEPYGRPETLNLSVLADSGDTETRRAYARAVSRVQDAGAVPLLRKMSGDRDTEVRRWSVYGLANQGTPAGDVYLRLLGDPDPESRRFAALGLRVAPDSSSAQALADALARPDSLVRYQAAFAFGSVAGGRPVDPLVLALKDPTAFVRRAALLALISAGRGDAALPVFLGDLKSRSVGTRRAAADALAQVANPQAARFLLEVARSDPDTVTRASAIVALGAVRAPESVPALLKLVRERDIRLRSAAVRGLGATGERRVIPFLIRAVEDTAGAVRDGAISALGKLTGQAGITDPRAWKTWWKAKGE